MNLVLLEDDDFVSATRVRLSGRRLDHVRSVLGVSEGSAVRVGRIGGPIGTGVVIDLDGESVTLELEMRHDPPPPLPVDLMLALPRPKVLSRVLSTITTMGVKNIILFDCWRVEKSFWSSPRLREDRIRAALIEGLEQARDTVLPTVRLVRRFRPFIEDELPGLIDGRRAIVADPAATAPPRAGADYIVAAVGPEGGFIPNEIAMFENIGFDPVSLGPRILHVEAAVPALLAKLS